MNLRAALRKYTMIDNSKLVILSENQDSSIPLVDCGILFVLATWSGAAQLAFRALNKALHSLANLDRVALYVADSDDTKTLQFMSQINDIPQGVGETYWISRGILLHKLAKYSEADIPVLVDYTNDLIKACHGGEPSTPATG